MPLQSLQSIREPYLVGIVEFLGGRHINSCKAKEPGAEAGEVEKLLALVS